MTIKMTEQDDVQELIGYLEQKANSEYLRQLNSGCLFQNAINHKFTRMEKTARMLAEKAGYELNDHGEVG